MEWNCFQINAQPTSVQKKGKNYLQKTFWIPNSSVLPLQKCNYQGSGTRQHPCLEGAKAHMHTYICFTECFLVLDLEKKGNITTLKKR